MRIPTAKHCRGRAAFKPVKSDRKKGGKMSA